MCLADELTLEKAVATAKLSERIKHELQTSSVADKAADGVSHRTSNHNSHRPSKVPNPKASCPPQKSCHQQPQQSKPAQSGRLRCGYTHNNRWCPASGKECKYCHRKGYFAKMCQKPKRVQEVVEDSDTFGLTELVLDAITIKDDSDRWIKHVELCGATVPFKIDTRADVTVILNTLYQCLSPKPPPSSCKVSLSFPGGKLAVKGCFDACITHHGKQYKCNIVVVSNEVKSNLLGHSASQALGFVARSHAEEVLIGLLNVELVKIELREGAEPYAVHIARNVGFNILPKVEEQLKLRQKEGIIKLIETPTEWCALMVPVIKKSGKVRICVDFKRLNQGVK